MKGKGKRKGRRINTEEMEIAMSDFIAYRLDRGTVLRPFIAGKDDLDFLTELLVRPGSGDLPPREMWADGRCFVAVRRGVIVGTITYYNPDLCGGREFYDRPEVACFGLMAVHPECRNEGVGTKMVAAVERMARKDGATELAVEMPEGVTSLVEFFKDRGYRPVDSVTDEALGKSVVLSKKFLDRPVIFGEYAGAFSKSEPLNGE